MNNRFLHSPNPLSKLLTHGLLVVLLSLYFVFLGQAEYLHAIIRALLFSVFSFYAAQILEQIELVKNANNAINILVFSFALMIPVVELSWVADVLMLLQLLLFTSAIKIYPSHQPKLIYYLIALFSGLLFLVDYKYGLIAILYLVPFVFFGGGFTLKSGIAYLMGYLTSVYFYYALVYIFDFNLVLPFSEINLIESLKQDYIWVLFIVLFLVYLFVFIPMGLIYPKEQNVERKFQNKVLFSFHIVFCAQVLYFLLSNVLESVLSLVLLMSVLGGIVLGQIKARFKGFLVTLLLVFVVLFRIVASFGLLNG